MINNLFMTVGAGIKKKNKKVLNQLLEDYINLKSE